jgi:hypothetical protein
MEIGKIILIAGSIFVIGLLLYYLFKRPGPWGIFWTSLLILMFGGLGANYLIPPEGSTSLAFAWIPAIFVMILFAVPVAITRPPAEKVWTDDSSEKAYRRNKMVLIVFFWTIILFVVGGSLVGLLV